MNQLSNVFSYSGQQVRTVVINDEPWFVAKDVCDILELTNVTRGIERLDDDEKGLTTIQTLGGFQELNVVNEAGLYNLIFTSRKDEAKQFKKWVTHEVLPQIRKTGSYVNPAYAVEDGIIHAMQGIKQLKEENAALKQAQAEQRQEMSALKLVVDNEIWLTENQKAEIQEKVKNRCGVLQNMGYPSSFQGIYSALKTHFSVTKYDKIPRKDFEKAIDFIRGWYPKKRQAN